jgi:hypothetical protein
MFDLLGGALAGTPAGAGLRRLQLSRVSWWAAAPGATRDVLATLGLTPYELMRRRRPVVLVDVVYTGGTFVSLLGVIRDWVTDERAQWDVVRLKLRFVGVTMRERPSPGTDRWWQDPFWVRELPRRALVSVALDEDVWSYFGDHQGKLTPAFLVEALATLPGAPPEPHPSRLKRPPPSPPPLTRGHRRGSTGSDSRASTANTASWTRHSGSLRAVRSRDSRPSAYSRLASERLWPSERLRRRSRLAGSV